MKTLKSMFAGGVLLMLMTGVGMAAGSQGIDLGVRYHMQHSEFAALPYADGDLSYGLGYEIQDENGLLQLLCGFTPEFEDRKDLDYAITPEANLLFTDGMFQGGLGILSTYTSGGPGGDDWMDLYWQWVLGLNVPLGNRLSLQANAYYVFESWSKLNKFTFEDVEFGGYLSYKF
jgi:hypothetical protein